ncbi:MAG: beta-galactosidase [Kiritimatiellae bacterium]|nr:beta-galactosidase [Kiritimatiellia bacterium]
MGILTVKDRRGTSVTFLSSFAIAVAVVTTTPIPSYAADIVLFDAATADASALSGQNGASFSLADGLLTVKTQPSDLYPGVCIAGKWDLSRYGRIEVEFVNGGINGMYTLRLLNPGGNPGKQKGSKVFKLPIKSEKHAVLGANMTSRNPGLAAIAKRLKPLRVWAFPYAAGVPYEAYKSRKSAPMMGIGELDPKDVVQVAVYINQPKLPHTWSVKRIVAKEGAVPSATGAAQEWTKLSEKDFFPYIDQYGQFRHKEWPDKVHSDADFARQREKEEKDLAAHPGPKGWDKWGGWADGPQLPKTGGFSTTKWNGKWWIVDPDGHLWWSHGPVRVLPSSAMTPLATPNGDRAGWFEKLPKRDDPVFGAFYETRDELLWPYYTKRGITSVYDFSAANIRRKYGEKWFETWADLAHRRLRSWGCNTIANSSDKRICLMDRTPYTERFEIHARPIAGHKGGWWEFCDPFDPSFRAEAKRMTEVYRAEIEDPWCMGFFVDNEHHWGAAHSFGLSTLKSPADQPCKAVFRDRMKAKYGTVAKLNAAWGMAYKDWDDFLRVMKEPKAFKGAKADLEAFSSEIAETYFRIIREELKRANPGKLYLGCRWAGGAPAFTVKAAAKYCDVISYNVYRKEMSGFKLPDGIDAPVMIGEFHFGALDRGPFCPGLILLRDQKHRAETYKEYVRTSLEHPQIVGVHWHQFSDQATSGRFDGENMQVGWTDVCDTPYWETVEAVREIGSRIYEIRSR